MPFLRGDISHVEVIGFRLEEVYDLLQIGFVQDWLFHLWTPDWFGAGNPSRPTGLDFLEPFDSVAEDHAGQPDLLGVLAISICDVGQFP